MWLLAFPVSCDIFFWACDPSPFPTVSSCLPFLAAKSSKPSIFSDAWHFQAYQGIPRQTMTSSHLTTKSWPVTRQIGQAALRHGLGFLKEMGFAKRTGFLVLGAAILLSNVSWTLRIHGLRCKRRYLVSAFPYFLSHIYHQLSPTAAHKYEAQTFSPHLSFIDVMMSSE